MKTVDISGMGGGYENECQKMLWAGIEYLKSSPGEMSFKELKGVFGIIDTSNSERAKECENVIAKVAKDCTGAMVHAVMSHLAYISKYGVDGWIKFIEDKELTNDIVFEWDGTKGSCPSGVLG